MCSSFTWGTVPVHYLLGLPLAYALCSATPNGLMLLVKLTYSPVMLRPIDSFYFPRCSILSPSNLVHCVLFTPLPHDTLSYSIFRLLCALDMDSYCICRPPGIKILTVIPPTRQEGGPCTVAPPCRGLQ